MMTNQQHIEGKEKKQNNMQYNNKRLFSEVEKINWYNIPIILIVAIFPLIIRAKPYNASLSDYAWFINSDSYFDYFLLYKKDFFLLLVVMMMLILIIRVLPKKGFLQYELQFIPLVIYAVLILMSSLFSKYREFSFNGIFEQFESVFVVLGYCIAMYYTYMMVKTEKDLNRIMIGFIFCIYIFGIIGLSQFVGHDIFSTEFGRSLIIPDKLKNDVGDLTMHFGNMAYITLYNPNYVSTYVSMIAPIFLCLILFKKKDWKIVFYILAFACLIFCLYAAQTSAGYISFGFGLIFLLILLWRYLIKYKKVVIPVICVALITVISLLSVKHEEIVDKMKSFFQVEQENYNLKEIQTNENDVRINYNNNIMVIQFLVKDENYAACVLTDDKGQVINVQLNSEGSQDVVDSRFPGFVVGPCYYDEKLCFFVRIDGKDWFFTNLSPDGSYYYLNQYGNYDKIVSAPTALFANHQHLFNNRGYLWSKTIPLLKNNILLGSGADTFALVYPQSDYVSQSNVGLGDQLVTKPHSMYLQIAVQYGVLALIVFLIFYGMYFISSLKLYIKGIFNSYYAQIGMGILVGTFSYMICGLTNDSSLTVAPIFWVLMGLGIAVNLKAKPMIEEELELRKTNKNHIKN